MKDLYIEGSWTEAASGAGAETINPADVDTAVAAARAAFRLRAHRGVPALRAGLLGRLPAH